MEASIVIPVTWKAGTTEFQIPGKPRQLGKTLSQKKKLKNDQGYSAI